MSAVDNKRASARRSIASPGRRGAGVYGLNHSDEAVPVAAYVADTRVCPTDRRGRPLAGRGSTLPAVDDAALDAAMIAVEQAFAVATPGESVAETMSAADPPGVPVNIDDDDTMRFVDFALL